MDTRRRIVALVPDEKLVGIGVLVRNLRLPLPGPEELVILPAQTGLGESDRLSALTRGRSRKKKTARAGKSVDPSLTHGHCSPHLSEHVTHEA